MAGHPWFLGTLMPGCGIVLHAQVKAMLSQQVITLAQVAATIDGDMVWCHIMPHIEVMVPSMDDIGAHVMAEATRVVGEHLVGDAFE